MESHVSENNGFVNGGVTVSESRVKKENRDEEEIDWFGRGLLQGYKNEKNRRLKLRSEQEDRTKKESERKKERRDGNLRAEGKARREKETGSLIGHDREYEGGENAVNKREDRT